MENQEKKNDFISQWSEFQKSFLGQWADFYGKMYQPWMDALKSWQEVKTPFAPLDLFSRWNELMRETIGKAAGQAEGGLGPDVFFRIFRASNVFVVWNEFWMEVLKDLPELDRVRGDDAKSREIFERWVERYKKVFEQMVGSPISDTAQEMMTSWLNAVQTQQAAMGLIWNPWIQAAPQFREQAERLMKGDWAALSGARSLWREVYDETLGQVFRMPAFGLTKVQTEKLRRTYDAFVRYCASLPHFYQFFYNTGMEALKQVFDRVQSLKPEEMKPETMREIYKIWWTTNENAFFELFKKPEFCNAMAEVVNYWLSLKKQVDDLTAEWCKALSIPSIQELDEIAMVVQDLRRKVRMQQKAIEKIQKRLEKTP